MCRRAERRLWARERFIIIGLLHRSWASKALRARRVAAKKREIAAAHERHTAGDDTVDPLTQRRVLPFDRGDMTRFSVEQHGGDFAPAHAFLFAIERAD